MCRPPIWIAAMRPCGPIRSASRRLVVAARNLAILTTTVIASVPLTAQAADWTRFRGPDANGIAEAAPAPLAMNPDAGYIWKRKIPLGKSSPVLAGPRLFFTAHEAGRLLTIAFDRETGATLWTRELRPTHTDERNPVNDAATPTPVTDGQSVYVFFADFGLAAYSVDGRELWRRPLGPFTSPHGIASSPLLADGMLVLLLEQLYGGEIVGIEAASGEPKWRVPRPASIGGSFATPVAYRTPEGETQAVVTSPFELAAYDLKTGEKLWRVGGLAHQPKSSPFLAGDLVLAGVQGDNARGNLKSWEDTVRELDRDGSGVIESAEISGALADYDGDGIFGRGDYDQWVAEKSPDSRLMAVRPRGRGDLTSQAVVWSTARGVPRVTTPLAYNGVVYMVRNGGILTALDLATGREHKTARLSGAIDEYFASPVAAGGRILTTSRSCKLAWIAAGPAWELLRVNDLGEECFATPALGHDGIFVRTTSALYRFAAAEARQQD
jgi:outer membrane protein assembly factor BamB